MPEKWVGLGNTMTASALLHFMTHFRSYFIKSQIYKLSHCTHKLHKRSTDVFTWTSAASPGPAPSRSEAFRFSSWKRKFGDSFFCHSKCFSRHDTTSEAWGCRETAFTAHLFQEVPGFLSEVRWKAEFAFQDFVNCLLSVFTGERRLQKSSRTETTVSNSSKCFLSEFAFSCLQCCDKQFYFL